MTPVMASGISSVEMLNEEKTVVKVTVVVTVVGLIAVESVMGVASMVNLRGTPTAGAGAPCGCGPGLGIAGVILSDSDDGILAWDVWKRRICARGIQELWRWVVEVESRGSACNSRVATCNTMQIEYIKRSLEEN